MSGRTETSFPARLDSITFWQKEWNTAEQKIKETLFTMKSLNLYGESLSSSAQVLETEVEKLETLAEKVTKALSQQEAPYFCGYSRYKVYERASMFAQWGSWMTTAASLGFNNMTNNSSSQSGTLKWVAFGTSISGAFFAQVNKNIESRWEKKVKAIDQLSGLLQRNPLIRKTRTIIDTCDILNVAIHQSSTASSSESLTNDNKLRDFSAMKLQQLINQLLSTHFLQEEESPVEFLPSEQSGNFSPSPRGKESSGLLPNEQFKDFSPVQGGTGSPRRLQSAQLGDVSLREIRGKLPLRSLSDISRSQAGRGTPVTPLSPPRDSSGSKGGKESVVPISGATLLNAELSNREISDSPQIRSHPSLTGS